MRGIDRVSNDAYHIALRSRDQSFIRTEVPESAAEPDTTLSETQDF